MRTKFDSLSKLDTFGWLIGPSVLCINVVSGRVLLISVLKLLDMKYMNKKAV